MTPPQIELARHALGLARKPISYRNRFVAGIGHSDYDAWLDMVEQGAARRRPGEKLPFGGDDLFHLTLAGAREALKPGETLDPEDFPDALL